MQHQTQHFTRRQKRVARLLFGIITLMLGAVLRADWRVQDYWSAFIDFVLWLLFVLQGFNSIMEDGGE